MDEILENSDCILQVDFYNENDSLIVPDTINYSIYDVISGTSIILNQPVTPIGNPFEINIDADLNIIIDSANLYEQRKVIINWTYHNGTKQKLDEFIYRVKNPFVQFSGVVLSRGYMPWMLRGLLN